MHLRVIIIAFFALFALGYAHPLGSFPENLPTNDRAGRITCDVFGSNTLCALHCIQLTYKGGYCNDKKICICRN
ncbi:unnamed protein product [Chironomus riparius]|uniref:Invertebrate defensins family profile domain-containing protein n=1 Tax=Chironomus riparius TaxID=315576 RepID=A0A9N9S207_9DIPT|nr:unnamed protein product [Chironomus riparius]